MRPRIVMSRTAIAGIALAAALASAACGVDRRLRIATEPPGAEVTVDGKYLGESPLELHFTHYGDRRVRVAKRGYAAIEKVVTIDAPWYGSFPFDLFSELIVPVWHTDFRDAHFVLLTQLDAPGLSAEERKRQEDEAVARGRALSRWAPGTPIPEVPAPRAESPPESSPSKPNEKP